MAAMTNVVDIGRQRRSAVAFPRKYAATAHDIASQNALTEKLAAVLGFTYCPDYQPGSAIHADGIYYVPSHTLVRSNSLDAVDPYLQTIQDDLGLYGGVVPFDFVATKAITHPLLNNDSPAPEGWSPEFGPEVAGATLAGYTVFSTREARMAAARLLVTGPVRVKQVQASGGRGQALGHDLRQLDVVLAEQDESEYAHWGLVLEEHLAHVQTFSVGQARIDGLTTSYVGTQSLTPDNAGQLVYGGSRLLCVRGDYEELLNQRLPEQYRQAIRMACQYDVAAQRCWPTLLASRRNYDVASGINGRGQTRMGVLEQSWRAGGASFAEACALEAFRSSDRLHVVRASTCERYGSSFEAPEDAQLVYRGDDSAVGFITKYGLIESYGNPE